MNDNQPATKGDLKVLKNELKIELKEELKIEIENGQKRYFGLITDHFDGKFETIRDALLGQTERLDRIEQNFEENDEEHRNFRVRISALERR